MSRDKKRTTGNPEGKASKCEKAVKAGQSHWDDSWSVLYSARGVHYMHTHPPARPHARTHTRTPAGTPARVRAYIQSLRSTHTVRSLAGFFSAAGGGGPQYLASGPRQEQLQYRWRCKEVGG